MKPSAERGSLLIGETRVALSLNIGTLVSRPFFGGGSISKRDSTVLRTSRGNQQPGIRKNILGSDSGEIRTSTGRGHRVKEERDEA